MKSSIAIIGFMGTGKTAVGRLLAEELGKQFLELDEYIAGCAGMSVTQIFEREGEIGFREREITAVKEITGRPDTVIACGGGIVLNTINTDRLRTFCHVVCLTASPAAISRRCRQDGDTRPMLNGEEPAQKIRELLQYRRPFYERAAEIIVPTTGLSVAGVVDRIIGKLDDL